MPELIKIEIRLQFTIQPREQVQIKCGGDASSVVLGVMEQDGVFFQIEADQQLAVVARQLFKLRQQGGRLGRRKIADA